jgi:PAS domain S-box-containing protein
VDGVYGAIEQAGLVGAVEQAADGIVLTDASGKILYVNPAFTAITGYTWEEAVGQNPRLLKSGRQTAAFYQELWSVILSGNVWQGEIINRRKDGTFYSEQMRIAPVRDASGETTGYIAIKHDVTEQRSERKALRRSQEFAQATIDALSSHLCVLDEAGTIISVNQAWKDFALANPKTGFDRFEDDAAGKNSFDAGANYLEVCDRAAGPEAAEAAEFAKGIRSVLSSECDGYSMEYPCNSPHEQRWFIGRVTRFLSNGQTRIIIEHINITERKRAEELLHDSEDRFRGVFEDAPVGIFIAGRDMRIIQVNGAICRMLGYSKQEMLAKTWPDLQHPDDLARALGLKEKLWSGQLDKAGGETRFIHRNGAIVWGHVKVSLLRSEDGSPLCSVLHVEDFTERKRADDALRESEERFRNMADSSPSMMWVTDAEGNIEFLNRALRKFYGIEGEEWKGIHWHLPIHPDDAAGNQALFVQAMIEHKLFKDESRVRRADGEWRLLGTNAEPRLSPDGKYMGHIGLCADITERKRAEAELSESRHLLQLFVDHSPVALAMFDREMRYLAISRRWAQDHSVDEQEIIGHSHYEVNQDTSRQNSSPLRRPRRRTL